MSAMPHWPRENLWRSPRNRNSLLASANSWRPSDYQELFTAGCDRLFAMGVDIVITNNVRSCIAQRSATRAIPPSHSVHARAD